MKKRLKWVITAVVVSVAGIALYSLKTGGTAEEVFKVSKGDIKQYIEDTAQVTLREKQTVYIEGSGKVAGVNVDVGDTVKKGDLLLSAQNDDLSLQLKDAEAKVAGAKAQLNGTELVNYANKIELAQAAVDQVEVTFDSAKRELDNSKTLYETNALSKEAFEKAQDSYKTAAAALNSANTQLADVKQGAPEYVKNGYEAQLEQAEINKDTIQRSIQKLEVRADMDGIILEKLIDKDSLVAPSTAAFVIGNVNNLELEADILTDDIGKVKIGNDVEISGKAINNTILKGRVIKIAPEAKTVTSSLGVNQNRIPVTIAVSDGTSLLRPGYSLDVKIITEQKNGILQVPDNAVFDYRGKSSVFVVENGKAVLRSVKKGIENDDTIEVDGLKEGEVIIVKPDNSIKEGAHIKPVQQKN